MNKFTFIVEKLENQRYYKIKADVDLSIKAESKGEASYISDSTLASIDNQSGYNINVIEEISEDEYAKLNENVNDKSDPFGRPFTFEPENTDVWENWTDDKKMMNYYETLFGDRTPSGVEKMEFYHKMRQNNIDKDLIYKFLSQK